MFLHFNFFHQRMLFHRYTTTTDCYFSLSVTMFLNIEFLPFFPIFVKIVVFITILCLMIWNKVLRTNEDSRTEITFILRLKFERLTNYPSNGFMILCNTNQNSYLLLSVTNKTSCTIEWINPETNVLFLNPV